MTTMKRARLKAPALPVVAPATMEEADRMVRRIADLARDRKLLAAALDEQVSRLKAEAGEEAAPLEREIANLVAAIQAWAEANRGSLTSGGRTKTVRMTSGTILWRYLPPSVQVRSADAVLDLLQSRGLEQFLRRKVEINREALRADPEAANAIPGIRVGSAGEEFVVEPDVVELAAAERAG